MIPKVVNENNFIAFRKKILLESWQRKKLAFLSSALYLHPDGWIYGSNGSPSPWDRNLALLTSVENIIYTR